MSLSGFSAKVLASTMLTFVVILGISGSVEARTVSVSQRVTVTAVVAPASYIVIDDNEKIQRIDSNTSQDVTPKVYIGSVAAGNERELTPAIYAAYLREVPKGANRVGTLYQRNVINASSLVNLNKKSDKLSLF